jgi:hypothetical protein
MARELNTATFGVNVHTLADHLKPETINKVAEYLYNAGYRKQSEWISVDERLPDKFGKYLTYRKSHCVSYVDILDYDTNQSVWSFFDSDWGDCEVDDVTHWMPLPEAPKMKGGE